MEALSSARRAPKPAPDENVDPIDVRTSTPASTLASESSKSAPAVKRKVKVESTVQLNARIKSEIREQLEEISVIMDVNLRQALELAISTYRAKL